MQEREKILGYLEGSSASEDITREGSHSILGKAMDAKCLEYYFTICNSPYENNVTLSKPIRLTAPPDIHSVALTAAYGEYELFLLMDIIQIKRLVLHMRSQGLDRMIHS